MTHFDVGDSKDVTYTDDRLPKGENACFLSISPDPVRRRFLAVRSNYMPLRSVDV